MEINITDILLSLISLFAAGGWWTTWRASKRKADGEATQSEAEGWARMQEVYQKHISDMADITETIRGERDHERERKEQIRHDYEELRDKYIAMEDQILELKKEISTLSRKLDIALPFSCGVANCAKRKRVELQEVEETEQL